MSTGDIIALIACTVTIVLTIISSIVWLCNKLEALAISIANAVTHEQCSLKRDNCPCVEDIAKINKFIDEKHPRR